MLCVLGYQETYPVSCGTKKKKVFVQNCISDSVLTDCKEPASQVLNILNKTYVNCSYVTLGVSNTCIAT